MLLSGGSEFIVGLALSLQAFGMMLTPMLGASSSSGATTVLNATAHAARHFVDEVCFREYSGSARATPHAVAPA